MTVPADAPEAYLAIMSRPVTEYPLSVEDYLRLEETSAVKHEYLAGGIHALAGASRRHNRIAGNIFARLLGASRGGPCRVYMSDVRLRAAEDVFYYPDVMAACGPERDDPMVEDRPCLVVEVTSPSTETIDRREKAMVYKRIPELNAYLVVHQDRRRVERHWRDASGAWQYVELVGTGQVALPCPEIELAVAEIYEDTAVEN